MKYRDMHDLHADIDQEVYLAFLLKTKRLRVPQYHILNILLKEWVEEDAKDDTRDYTWQRTPHAQKL